MPLPPPKFEDGEVWDGTTPHSRPSTNVYKGPDGEIGNRHSAEILALEDLLNGVIEELGILENPGAANSLLGVLNDQSGLEYKTLIEGAGITLTHAAGSITITDNHDAFFNGTFRETFDALVTSDGVTITLTLQQSPTGDLTMQFSSGAQILDCTSPAQTIELTAGTDSAPKPNYIYIPNSTKVMTKSTTDWPSGEHIKIAYCLVPSATFVFDHGGGYINQNWNDHLQGTDNQGHLSHVAKKIRRLGAAWFSGVNPDGATASYFTIAAGSTLWKSTAGVISQMHEHDYMAQDMAVDTHAVVVNDNTAAYTHITDLYSITEDDTGTTIGNNRYFNLVFYGVANKSGEFTGLMVNLPSGFYVLAGDAAVNAGGYDVYDIPREFNIDSGTGFLICRATFKMGSTWTHVSTVDLRGRTPYTVSGAGANDHGGLAGLGDVADHPGYLLVDGTRDLTGNMAVDALITIDGRDLSVDGAKLDGIENSADVTDVTNVTAAGGAMSGGAFHDGFSDFVADEHVLHAGVSISPGTGLSGGGNISATRTLSLSHLGLESLTDPGEDRILFWDDSETGTKWLTVGDGLAIAATTLTSGFTTKCRATPSLEQDIVDSLWTKVTLGTVDYIIGGSFINDEFVAPVNGYYLITVAARTAEFIAADKNFQVGIYIDGIQYLQTLYRNTGTTSAPLRGNITDIVYMTVNQTAALYVRHTHGSNRKIEAAAFTYMAIHRLS